MDTTMTGWWSTDTQPLGTQFVCFYPNIAYRAVRLRDCASAWDGVRTKRRSQ
jgi:hypothetical protein